MMGLNSKYNTISGNILVMRPLPSVIETYSLLIHEERKREIQAASPLIADYAALNATTQNNFKHGNNQGGEGGYKGKFDYKKSVTCEHFKKPGHTANKCYRLVGFPKDFKFTKGRKITAHTMSEEESVEENGNNKNHDELFN
ncbi:unnamed protein product [Cuscuta campestris]|uniref:Uncharacterized protein n=1 Tax=Cuscuta campestris TaxID=132261 RepID=A0A484KVP1_9ASTE|nr:unnamed protein product [Cuscuta campestris]